MVETSQSCRRAPSPTLGLWSLPDPAALHAYKPQRRKERKTFLMPRLLQLKSSGEHFSKSPNGVEFAVDGTGTCPTIAVTIPSPIRGTCWLCAGDAQVAPLRSRCHERRSLLVRPSGARGLHFTSSRCSASQPHGRPRIRPIKAQRRPVASGDGCLRAAAPRSRRHLVAKGGRAVAV